MFFTIHIPVLAACILHLAQATLKNTGTTVVLNDIPYYVSPDSVATMPVFGAFGRAKSTGLLPMTVFTASAAYYTESEMNATVTKYLADDDVFQTEFLDGKSFQMDIIGRMKYWWMWKCLMMRSIL